MIKTETFRNAQEAFEHFYNMIHRSGTESGGTLRLLNVGFYIANPLDNEIRTEWRKWNPTYANREWAWYLSGDRSVKDLKRYAPIWNRMHGGDDIVNSNYGYQWQRNDQLDKVIGQLITTGSATRQAYVTIYDGKEKDQYAYDTPCTMHIGFIIEDNKLCMNVVMRSNDLWYGFCNDQFCFSNLQLYVASQLRLDVGWYFHFAHDLHIYSDQLNKHRNQIKFNHE